MTARLRVLIVEDSETDAKLIVRELGRTGHAIETERVQEAATLRAALERPWDVVISDWSMPVLTADEAMAIVRERQPDVPFIIVSGTIGEETAVAAMRAGASDFLLKDRLVRLGAAVERELRDSQLRAAHRRAIDDLRASEARYRVLFENSPLPKWLYDVETLRVLEVNEAAVRHYGYPRDELLAMSMGGIRRPGDVAEPSDDARGSSMGAVQHGTARHRKKDGTVIDVQESGYTFTLGGERARLVVVQDITERLRAEEALRASEEQFRLLLDSTGEAIYGIDLDGNCTFANAACARMIGFLDGRQLIGRNMHQLIHHTRPDGMSYPVAECRLYQAGLRGEGGVFDDEVLFRVDGSHFAAEYRAFPLRRGGVRVGAVISFVDVTARREAEQSMRWLAAIVEAAAEGIIGTDARGIITSWNPGATRIYGYGAAEALGRHISLIAPPDRSSDAREVFARAVEGAIVQDYETERVRKDGRRIEVAVTLSPIRDAAGAVRGVSGVTRDITERRIAEQQVRLLHTIALAASQADDLGAALEVVLRLLCEATGVAVAGAWVPGASGALEHRAHWARSGDGETVRRFVEGWSFAPERGLPGRVLATRKPAWIVDLAAEADFLRAEVALELGLHAGFALPIVVGDEVVAVLELFFAEPRPPDSRLIELVDALAAHVGSVLQRRRAEEALRRSEEQLRQAQKLEAIGSLAGGIAHDFNNLLSVILAYAELLISDLEPCDPMREHLEEVKKAGERAAALTWRLLAFSRRQILQPRIVDLEDVVSSMAAMLRRLIGEDVELTFIPATRPARVCVDPGQIEQVIMNLAVNARDAMPQGGKLTVELGHVELDAAYAADHPDVTPGRHVMLAVTDTGVGMDRATQARIFEPFFTTKEPGKGTGLGLSTVFGIVRQSAGTVWVYSEPGTGTTFKVYLPVAGAESKPVPISRSSAPVRLRGSETILLVEDDEHVRRLVRTVLVRHGYNVLEASNGGEALLICEEDRSPIHALLTDVVMPRMSGRRLAARLRSLRPELRVVYMSGYPDGSVVEHGLVDDLASYVQKPITTETLLTVLRTALDDGA